MLRALQFLEAKYERGVSFCKLDGKPTIAQVMSQSVVVAFSTSKVGWQSLGKGQLLEKAPGQPTKNGHACLVESYNFAQDFAVIRNSWFDNSNSNAHTVQGSELFERSMSNQILCSGQRHLLSGQTAQ